MFYDQVKSLCESRNLAMSALSRNLHLSPSAPMKWKEGTLPKAETIMKISEFFDVTTDYLLYGADQRGRVSASNVSDESAMPQQHSRNSVSIVAGALDVFEGELVRIYRALSMKGKVDLIQAAFTLEAKEKKGEETP